MIDISIIIVHYKVPFFVEQLLCSIYSAKQHLNLEIIIVDNDEESILQKTIKDFSEIIYIKNEENIGFGKACNIGAKEAKGKYLLFLNPDTLVFENTLVDIFSFAESNKNICVVGTKQIDAFGNFAPESKRNLPNSANSFAKILKLKTSFGYPGYYNENVNENEIGKVEILSGACMLIPKKVFEQVNGFDEQFFMYAEDIDLCHRIHLLGYENYYLGNTSIIHFKGESSKQNNPEFIKNFYGAMKLFVDKHYSNKSFSKSLMKIGIDAASTLAKSKNKNAEIENTEIEAYNLIGASKSQFEAEKIILKNGKTISNSSIESKNNCKIFCLDKLDGQFLELIKNVQQDSVGFHFENTNSILIIRKLGKSFVLH